MSNLSLSDKAFLEGVLAMGGGFVLDFSNATFANFFAEISVDIYDNKAYPNGALSDSKANRLRAFWKHADNQTVARSIRQFSDYIDAKRLDPGWVSSPFDSISDRHIAKLHEIADRLQNTVAVDSSVHSLNSSTPITTTSASVSGDSIQIEIHPDIYRHIKQYLDNKDYFHSVEESYKVVREKLREITGKEKAHEAFSEANYVKIFGHTPSTEPEKDFFEGVKFLNMSIQKLRNEKAHTLAQPIDANVAIHYISLASLAYDLITQKSAR